MNWLTRSRVRRFLVTQVASRIRALRQVSDTEYERQKRRRREPGLSSIDPTKPVYIFFAPEAGVGVHFATHCMVARTLTELGHQVLMVRCDNSYWHCVVMDMFTFPIGKTPEQRKYACEYCREREHRMSTAYRIPSVDLADLVDTDTITEIERQSASMPADAGEFEVDGVRFGALCGSDLALSMKTLDQLRATGEARRMLEAYVAGALLSYRAVQSLIRKLKVARVIFFNEYGMLASAALAAIKAGVPTTRMSLAIHKNVDRRKIILLHDPLAIITYHKSLDEWPRWRELALSPAQVEIITDNHLSRIGAGGFSVYSPKHSGAANDIFDRLKLSPDRRVLVAYTSSVDEFNSNLNLMKTFDVDLFSKEQPFRGQLEWLEALIEYVERSKHLQLIIRIHPREGKTARENRSSEHLTRLVEKLSESYKHVRIIWPEDQTSSYDLSEIADLALTGWSNITLELARFGIPIITAFKRYVPFPTPDVVQWAPTQSEYFSLLEWMLKWSLTLDSVRYAYRWSYVYSLSMSVDFGDVIPAPDYHELPTFKLSAAAPEVESILVGGKSVVEINRQKMIEAQSGAAVDEETNALRRQMRRMIWFMATGEDRKDDYLLFFGDAKKADAADVVVMPQGQFVEFCCNGKSIRRRSQAMRRLAMLAANVPVHSSAKVNVN